jgi:hypothetical protein
MGQAEMKKRTHNFYDFRRTCNAPNHACRVISAPGFTGRVAMPLSYTEAGRPILLRNGQ